jgi:hypothetical protein
VELSFAVAYKIIYLKGKKLTNNSYLFSLDYGDRKNEKQFVGDILDNFDNNSLIGVMLWINNNPYSFELFLFLNFEQNSNLFENWLKNNYPNKRRIYNVFNGDFFKAMSRSGYNGIGLTDRASLDFSMPSDAVDKLFLFPDRDKMNDIFGQRNNLEQFTVFLSHSSKNKNTIEHVFNGLQKAEISCWFDKYEISAGDSITDKINEGLENSNLGLLFLSKDFIYSESGWTMNEANYFFQRKMRNKDKKFIVINIDLNHDELPPMMQDYKYIDYKQNDSIQEIIHLINKEMNIN